MKSLEQILIGLTVTVNCFSQKISDREKISNSVTSFYQWYIGTTKDLRYSTYVRGVEGENGMTKLETSDYFKRLDSLGTIGKEFIKSERQRFKPCEDFLRKMPWAEFSAPDNFPAEDKCGFIYSYYWTGGHEPYDGVEIRAVKTDKNSAIADTYIYFGDKTLGRTSVVHLIKRENKWVITEIERGK